jgi:hypothetical protein
MHRVALPRDAHAAAPGDAQAASFPAPPMPLTDQEKLLLRIVHKRDPVEMAMLDPEVRNRQHAADKTDFQNFFKTSTPELSIQGATK